MTTLPRGKDLGLFILVVAIGLLIWRGYFASIEAPRADAVRYLDYATNLVEYKVFGLGGDNAEPPAGRANAPLYPAFLAFVFDANNIAPGDLRCYLHRTNKPCNHAALTAVLNAQVWFVAAGLVGIWLTGWLLLGRRGAWTAAAMALLSGQLTGFANQLLTENFSILLCAWLTLLLLLARDGRARWQGLLGLVLGALTLNRPEFAYLGYAFIALGWVSVAARSGRRRAMLRAAALTLGFVLVCGPWMWRNADHFGDPALTESYGGRILAQRVRYNQMSTRELAVAFVYWLPDFGDSLAERLFPPEAYVKLSFGPGTYYITGLPYHDAVADRVGGEQHVTRTLLIEDVFGHPIKHAAVTLALAWRAVFVGKLWGLTALLAFVAALVLRPDIRPAFASLSAPAWYMLLFYAAVSVSIPRYAVCFVPIFSLSFAALLARRERAH